MDIIVGDYAVFDYLLKTSMSDLRPNVEKMGQPLLLSPLFALFPKSKPESEGLRNSFNKGLEMIKLDGTLDKILKQNGLK